MAGRKVNFADVERYTGLGEGTYTGHIEKINFREGKPGKSDQLSVLLIADEGDNKGESAFQNLYFSEKSMFRMADFFELFGIEEADFDWEDEPPHTLLDPDLSGEPVVFEVVNDPYEKNGKTVDSMKATVIEWLGKPKARASTGRRALR